MKNSKKYILIFSIIVIVILITIFGNNVLKDTRASSETVNNIINENGAIYITNLYNNAVKEAVRNNDINYSYAPSVSLMNDNFNNIRYYGASPNNYIDIGDVYDEDITIGNWEKFGGSLEELGEDLSTQSSECYKSFDYNNLIANGKCEDEISCNEMVSELLERMGLSKVDDLCGITTYNKGTPKLYRIIGVFDGKLKVIKKDSIGLYSWDTSDFSVNNGQDNNKWSQANLMKLLNPGYESEEVNNSLWWNSMSGTCYNGQSNTVIPCNFRGTGLSDNAKSNIASATWYIGSSESYYADESYKEEQKESWIGKVGLMNLTDYIFATDFDKCNAKIWSGPMSSNNNHKIVSTFLENSNYSTCYDNNWLYNAEEWLITPYFHDKYVWYMRYYDVYGIADFGYSYYSKFVRPVMHLVPDVNIIKGDGTEANPYIIGNLYSASINYYYLEDGKETTKKISDSYILNNLENNYNEVVRSPKIEGCKASKEEVNIAINNSDFTDNVYYSCDIAENVKTGSKIIIIISLLGATSLILIIYYYFKKKKNK